MDLGGIVEEEGRGPGEEGGRIGRGREISEIFSEFRVLGVKIEFRVLRVKNVSDTTLPLL